MKVILSAKPAVLDRGDGIAAADDRGGLGFGKRFGERFGPGGEFLDLENAQGVRSIRMVLARAISLLKSAIVSGPMSTACQPSGIL